MSLPHRIRTSGPRGLAAALLFLTYWIFGATPGMAQERTEPWSDETIKLFASLPVQHGGRVKPLDKFAALHLLIFNGKRKLEIDEDTKLKPTPWLLDCFFFPEQAKTYPCFRVGYGAVVTAIGLQAKEKFDWYSYNELQPGRHKLDQEASRIAGIEAADRTAVQRLTLKLASDLFKFESLIGTLEPLRHDYSTGGSPELEELFGKERSSLAEVLVEAPSLNRLVTGTLDQETSEFMALRALFADLDRALEPSSGTAAFLPPNGLGEEELTWMNMPDLVMASFKADLDLGHYQSILASLQRLEELKNQPEAFHSELESVSTLLIGKAAERGEYSKIPLEITMDRLDPFTKALAFFLLGFVLLASGWLFPKNVWISRGLWASVGVGVLFVITGIVMRCVIRNRPPVVSLYDTIVFITGSMVLVSLFLEKLTRQRIAIGVGSILGVAGMFLAMRYELKEIESAGDTMASVVAVLDTNYYLAIHVTTITLGYAGGLLAGALAHVWILGQLFGYRAGDKLFYKSLTRMIYGILCFCLLFAIFGTIMGGVWANDSWGRFWGWDPKENGALLICIWGLLTLHMRLGGYIRDRGLAIMAVIGGVVVSASWWGVNLLNVGLHSYGFTSGVGIALMTAWALEALVLGMAGLDVILRRTRGTPA